MVIYCDSDGNVQSVPSSVAFGEKLTDITIVTPQQSAAVVLKVFPPSGMSIPGAVCSPTITDNGVIVYNAKLHKGVTVASGRCYYQLEFYGRGKYTAYDEEGQEYEEEGIVSWPSEEGSFNIQQGTNVDLPSSEDALKEYALEQYYALFESLSSAGLRITAAENLIGTGKQLLTPEKNLIDAINKIYNRPTISTDDTLSIYGRAADALTVGNKFKTTNEQIEKLEKKIDNFLDVDDEASDQLSELLGYISANKDLIESITTQKADASVVKNLSDRVEAIEKIPIAEEVSV